ncbi:MAG: YihY/virulence factor BrkB family protein [Lachnospiraceae bacterium]|nr:YihY/virulence factor BrkB family protein [Lachnospiraceae bacterium]MEE3460896.1 YihY/virulence factor BrkB family protein [Lachnospiraceae bacterium]
MDQKKDSLSSRIFKAINIIMSKVSDTQIGANAGQASFMLILSFFPFVLFLLTMIKYTDFSRDYLIESANDALPPTFAKIIESLVNEIFKTADASITSITIILALWLGSRAALALIYGLDSAYQIKTEDRRNYFLSRFLSIIYTILLAIIIIFSLAVLVFGKTIIMLIIKYFPNTSDILEIVLQLRSSVTFIVMFILFTLMYRYLPNHLGPVKHMRKNVTPAEYKIIKRKYKKDHHINLVFQMPGAAISVAAWLLYSYIYSYFFIRYTKYTTFYGTATNIALLMVWLYFCMYIYLFGGIINAALMSNEAERMVKALFGIKSKDASGQRSEANDK